MAVPKYDELMKPLLAAVKDGEVYKIKDVTAVLAQQLNLSAEDLAEMLPSGQPTAYLRVSFPSAALPASQQKNRDIYAWPLTGALRS